MSERKIRDYVKYSDFNENATHKSSLASLSTFCREIILAYDKMDAEIKKLLVDNTAFEGNLKGFKEAIQAQREEHKEAIKIVLSRAHRVRQERDSTTTLRQFEKAMDVFLNVGDASEPDDPLHVELETKVSSLEREVANLEKSLREAKEKLSQTERAKSSTEEDEEHKDLIDTQKALVQSLENQLTQYRSNVVDYKSKLPSISTNKPVSKLDSKTPVFKSRTDEDIETWLYKIETALEVANIPSNIWLAAVANYVEGTAFEMVMTARRENQSWDQLKTKLLHTFRATFKDFHLRSRLLALKDMGNFDKYLYEFRHLANRIPQKALSDGERLNCFVQGLRPQTRKELFLKESLNTLEEAILFA